MSCASVVKGCLVSEIPINLPNSLTGLRILLVPVFVGLLLYENYDWALLTLLIAAITDGLDGAVARLTDQRTRLGEYLDPLADKLLLTSAIITLSIVHFIPLWAVIVVVSRDAILLAGTLIANLTETDINIAPTIWGKSTTFAQISYVIALLLHATGRIPAAATDPLLVGMIVLTVGSGVHYLMRGIQYVNAGSGSQKDVGGKG